MEESIIKAENERQALEVRAAITKGEMRKLEWERTSQVMEYHSSSREDKTMRHVGSFVFFL